MNMNKWRILQGGADGTESLSERKKRLRLSMKKRRSENENRDVKERFLAENALELIGGKKSVFIYLSFSSEAKTDKLVETLLANGIKVYAPRVEGKEMVAVPLVEDGDFDLSDYGVREPIGQAYDGEIEAAIVPFLAVDLRGVRLGYGGGYYDKFFAKHPEIFKVGYGYDFQIVDELPESETDVRLNAIVTDQRVIRIEKIKG
jgi:5-formyltetrahydrofolate cyclo-ligase